MVHEKHAILTNLKIVFKFIMAVYEKMFLKFSQNFLSKARPKNFFL